MAPEVINCGCGETCWFYKIDSTCKGYVDFAYWNTYDFIGWRHLCEHHGRIFEFPYCIMRIGKGAPPYWLQPVGRIAR